MRLKWILITFIFLSLNIFAFNMGVAPTSFHIDLNNNHKTKEVIVLNNTNKPMRIEIAVEKPKDYKEEFYLGKWIRLYPKIINIRPQGKQKVRFAIRIPKDIPKGKYKSYLVFKEIPKLSEMDSSNINIEMITEIAISIYGDK